MWGQGHAPLAGLVVVPADGSGEKRALPNAWIGWPSAPLPNQVAQPLPRRVVPAIEPALDDAPVRGGQPDEAFTAGHRGGQVTAEEQIVAPLQGPGDDRVVRLVRVSTRSASGPHAGRAVKSSKVGRAQSAQARACASATRRPPGPPAGREERPAPSPGHAPRADHGDACPRHLRVHVSRPRPDGAAPRAGRSGVRPWLARAPIPGVGSRRPPPTPDPSPTGRGAPDPYR